MSTQFSFWSKSNIIAFLLFCTVLPRYGHTADIPKEMPKVASPPEMSGDLTLASAIGLALKYNPRLAVFDWEIRAIEARTLQAQLRPNPEFSFEIEDIMLNSKNNITTTSLSANTSGGWSLDRSRESDTRSGFDEAMFTARLSQIIELGGKRAERIAEARQQIDVARWDYEVARVEVLAEVAESFIDVVAAQERLEVLQQLLNLALQVEKVTHDRVEGGKISALELKRVQIEAANAQIEVQKAQKTLDASRVRLAATWGSSTPQFTQVLGRLDAPCSPPPIERILERVSTAPLLKRWAAELDRRSSTLALEQAKRIPDMTVEFGLRTQGQESRSSVQTGVGSDGLSSSRSRSESDSAREHSLLLGFSVPLPLFNRNQGAVLEAKHRIAQAEAEKHAVRINVQSELAMLYHSLTASYDEILAVEQNVLPKAKETFEGIQEGYLQGKFGLIDVLDAQRTLFDGRQNRLSALVAHHKTILEMERLLGEPLLPETTSQPLNKPKE